MFWNPDTGDHGLPFNPLKSCVVPRPIGWITTLKPDGRVNLAPNSQFALLGFEPGYVGFSGSVHPSDLRRKDSIEHAERTGEFVYNMATLDNIGHVNVSSQIIDSESSELEVCGLTAAPSICVSTPRLLEAPVSFECRVHTVVMLPGNTRASAHWLVIGRVVGVHIDDAVIGADGKLDIARIKPVARLGYADYTWVDKVSELPLINPALAERRKFGFYGGR